MRTEDPAIDDTIVVFTARSPEQIVAEGGSQSWVLNPVRSRQSTWLLCTQNRHNADHGFDATQPHGTGFLLGRISEIRKSEEGSHGRWMIAISEYALISIPNAWDRGRNPVRYTSLNKFNINLDELTFLPMPEFTAPPAERPAPAPVSSGVLTITEAKKQLAAAFGIKPDAIEITIRG
jgi:hypothetical protein